MGPFMTHMIVHILLMNFVAPLAAFAVSRRDRSWRVGNGGSLGAATFLQLAALWIWHAPAVLDLAMVSPALHLLMYGSLFATALLFWTAVLDCRGARAWQPIVALLVTSKIYCLLAVLLVFAPRALYPGIMASHVTHGTPTMDAALADQQLAGLVMLAACPITYIVAGLVIAAHWLRAMGESGAGAVPKLGTEGWT
ncbi:cytochrome c oxidase assembly protein [Ciceribacter thiooxidans]|uniref:Cytochrome c oxidase assembly protein n=1 Tax=Ciceribacter thiooxidans TaxID=1969821 RepID=A0ABV7I6L3_9HYPH|nr:cytochrome c oxidase assembly protein [Ciceribacter thiooxidans]